MAQKPSVPKGTRDIMPQAMLQRDYILNILKENFKKFGFQPIATPAMEKVENLTGKYGEEGDRLIFKILPRGRKLHQALAKGLEGTTAFNQYLEEALRYDLTVPFARFVVQNQNEINFPFKRYQIQPVWRADRPQKGRFREFYQCDADVVGSKSLLLELDFISLYHHVFEQLNLPVKIKLNHRQVLAGLTENFGIPDQFERFTIALDKLDKVPIEKVEQELKELEQGNKIMAALRAILELKGSFRSKMDSLKTLLGNSPLASKGIEDLEFIYEQATALGTADKLELDLCLARGLDYYTGSIFEVKVENLDLGSVGGGGRYDDLTGIFGMKDLPGIGISFGLDRIQLALEELGLFPDLNSVTTQLLVLNFGEKEALFSYMLLNQFRSIGVKAEIYPDPVKIKKQLDYANKNQIEYVLIIGSKEIEAGLFILKNMKTGEQRSLAKTELLEFFNSSKSSGHGVH